jgi:hypothetical protein
MRATLPARLGSGIAVTALASACVVATAGVATAATSNGGKKPAATTYLHLNSKAVAHARHHTDTITGRLATRRTGVTGETVTLKDRTGKHRRWVVLSTDVSGTKGAISFTIAAPGRTTQYEAVFAGDTTRNLRKSHSNVITITVRKHSK